MHQPERETRDSTPAGNDYTARRFPDHVHAHHITSREDDYGHPAIRLTTENATRDSDTYSVYIRGFYAGMAERDRRRDIYEFNPAPGGALTIKHASASTLTAIFDHLHDFLDQHEA